MHSRALELIEKIPRESNIPVQIVSRSICKTILQFSLEIKEYDVAVRYGTKLVAQNDSILKDFVMEYEDEPPSIENISSLDINEHFACFELLANAAAMTNNFPVLINANIRCLELAILVERLKKYVIDENGNDRTVEIFSSKFDDPVNLQLELCFNILRANDYPGGDAFLSVNHGRRACELDTIIHKIEKPDNEMHDLQELKHYNNRLELIFLMGKAFYKLALQLSGGPEFSSSPPIAILASSQDPSVKSLLEDALKQFQDAMILKSYTEHEKITKRAIGIQLSIIYLELREEKQAKKCIQNLHQVNLVISILARKYTDRDIKYVPEDIRSVLFSNSVIKRLSSLLAPEQNKIEIHRKPAPIKRMISLGKILNVECSFCLINVRDPIKCESCNSVQYCTEECKMEHLESHRQKCSKNWF